jgi:hypothetical protein
MAYMEHGKWIVWKEIKTKEGNEQMDKDAYT